MVAGTAIVLCLGPGADAATLAWKGHTWQVTSGGMAGVCQGDPNNVTVDASGYLHLRISNGATGWTSSELFTTDRLGLGTYQWQVDGPIDSYDKNVVLGLFPYGPAAGIGTDGTNEIDIEYARWGQASGPNGDWTDYPASGTTIGELSYTFSLAGTTLSTSRFVWSSSSIADTLLSGLQPVDGTTGLIKSWTYAPANPTVNVPQQALPLGMNLWCFDSPPSDGNPVEIVIRDFVFVPASGAGGAARAGPARAGLAVRPAPAERSEGAPAGPVGRRALLGRPEATMGTGGALGAGFRRGHGHCRIGWRAGSGGRQRLDGNRRNRRVIERMCVRGLWLGRSRGPRLPSGRSSSWRCCRVGCGGARNRVSPLVSAAGETSSVRCPRCPRR